jgi:hypothetical protein
MNTRTDVAAGLLVQLLCALPVDVEQHVAARAEDLAHRRLWRAVAVAEDVRPFQELAVADHVLEPGEVDEMIVDAFHFAPAAAGGS